MATDYKRIAKENIKRFGTAIHEYGPQLLADRYSDRTHFVYELLQNAEDAIGSQRPHDAGVPRNVAFELKNDCLLFRHDGLPFTEENVRGICDIGKGTKKDDLTAIGTHGIGFKSVYAYTHHPEVHSGEERFVIDSFVRPRATRSRPTRSGETLIVIPFDHPEIPQSRAYTEIAERLGNLGLKSLLFLRNIESISWQTDCGRSGRYSRERLHLRPGFEQVTLRAEKHDFDTETQDWLVCHTSVEYEGKAAGFIEIAFSLRRVGSTEGRTIVPLSDSPLVVFFPTDKETHFGFLVQGPYCTTPSRDNVPKDDPWNQSLVHATAKLLGHCLKQLRNMNLLTVGALEALVVSPAKYQGDSQAAMFRPICEAIVDALRHSRLIPSVNRHFLSGSHAYFTPDGRLRELLNANQLRHFLGEHRVVRWVTGDISREQSPFLYAFLRTFVSIEEISSVDFLRRVSPAFLIAQTDAWISKFYAFLNQPPFPRVLPTFHSKEIVRLEDGSHVTPCAVDGTPNAYLPGKVDTHLPTVRRSVCKSDDARRFLQDALGLREPDDVDDVCSVLHKYRASSRDRPLQYEEDVRRIVAAFHNGSNSRRNRLLNQLRHTHWIACRNAATSEILLRSADHDTYLPTEKLRELFAGNHKIWFVDQTISAFRDNKARSVLEACGVAQYLQRKRVACSLTLEEFRQIRAQAGLEDYTKTNATDYTISGLTITLEEIRQDGEPGRQRRVEMLWRCLYDAIQANGSSFLFGEYSWSYSRQTRVKRFTAQFVRLLCDVAWLPLPSGELARPSQIRFAELPKVLRDQAHPDIIDVLMFKPDEGKQLAAMSGIPEDVLDLIRDSGLSADELRIRLGIAKPTARLDSSTRFGTSAQEGVEGAISNILGNELAPPEPLPPLDIGSERPGSGATAGVGKRPEVARERRSDAGGFSSRRNRYHTYVATEHEQPMHERQDTQEAKTALETAAVELILREDTQAFSQIRRMPVNHEGYDLEAVADSGEVERYVEVKALACDWRQRPATMSDAQFKAARRLGNKYWLYVVERAGQSNARIHRIRDPAASVRYFTYDHGWAAVATD